MMFFQKRTTELPYQEIGIQSIILEVNPKYSLQMPLDVIFRLIHATHTMPFIKYNPGKRQEKNI